MKSKETKTIEITMKSSSTFGISFFIKKYKAKNNKAPVYARITVDGVRLDVSMKKEIEVDNWSDGKGMAKGKSEEIRKVNTYLEQVRARMVECYQQLILDRKLVTADAIKNAFLGETEKEHSLNSIIEYHNSEFKQTMEWGTLKNYLTTQNYIARFLKERLKTSDVFLSELNYKFLTDFEMWLRKLKPDGNQRACGNNTVMKHIERLRKIINLAVKNEWLKRDPFISYKKNYIRTSREFLNDVELKAIENKVFRIERLQQVKDLFVFSCYTGLAYIDVMQLTRANITRGIDGEHWLYTSRQKTDNSVRIPLLPTALEMIEKYKEHPTALSKGTLFPVISNQKLNSYLKEIADLCSIEKNLTFHLARHTFATTVTLTNGVPIETVSKLLGHTSIRTTQIYAKVVETKVSQDMKNLKDKLFNTSNSTVYEEKIKEA